MTGPGIYDPTTIMNHDQLQKVSREGWIKLGFYLLSFFYYLYAYVFSKQILKMQMFALSKTKILIFSMIYTMVTSE